MTKPTIKQLQNELKQTGHRLSLPRVYILQYLRNTLSHPPAEAVYEHVKKNLPNISLGTIYRNLNQMTETGLVRAIHGTDGKTHYDGDTGFHLHFKCKNCKRIFDVFHKNNFYHKDLAKHGEIHCLEATATGICRNCQNKK